MPIVQYCIRCWKLRKSWTCNQQSLTYNVRESMTSEVKIKQCSRIDVTDGVDLKLDAACSSSSITPLLPSSACAKRKQKEQSGEVASKKMQFDDSSSASQASTCTSLTSTPPNFDGEADVCRICRNGICNTCWSNPNNGVITHNSTSHQFCCYQCAKRLKKKGKPCPVCRQPIGDVFKNYIVQL